MPHQALEFNGERFTTSYGGPTAIEHWHRYLLARELARDRDVLDIASGEGYGSALLAQTARSVVGIDVSESTIAHAQSAYARPNLRYLTGSALQIPLAEASVDMVVSFEHWSISASTRGFCRKSNGSCGPMAHCLLIRRTATTIHRRGHHPTNTISWN